MEQQVQLLSIKKEEEEEADITDFPLAAAVKSENEEKVHSLFHHVKNEYKDEEEPQTSSSGKKTMKLHQHFFSVRNQVLYFVCFCCGFVSFTSVMLLLKYGGYFFRARFKNK